MDRNFINLLTFVTFFGDETAICEKIDKQGNDFFSKIEITDTIDFINNHKSCINECYLFDMTYIQKAVELDNYEVVDHLLKNGANPNVFTTTGNCPIASAVYNKNYKMVDLLLKHDANPAQLIFFSEYLENYMMCFPCSGLLDAFISQLTLENIKYVELNNLFDTEINYLIKHHKNYILNDVCDKFSKIENSFIIDLIESYI